MLSRVIRGREVGVLPYRFILIKIGVYKMRVIVAGSRDFTDYGLVKGIIEATISKYNIPIEILVHGGAKGVDLLAKRWADSKGILAIEFPAHWHDLDVPGAVIKTNKYGKYNSRAGHDRNIRMAEYGNVLIAIRKNNSPGTTHMINTAVEHGLRVYVKEVQ